MAVAQAFNPSTQEAKASLVVYRERERVPGQSGLHKENPVSTHTHTYTRKKEEGRRGWRGEGPDSKVEN